MRQDERRRSFPRPRAVGASIASTSQFRPAAVTSRTPDNGHAEQLRRAGIVQREFSVAPRLLDRENASASPAERSCRAGDVRPVRASACSFIQQILPSRSVAITASAMPGEHGTQRSSASLRHVPEPRKSPKAESDQFGHLHPAAGFGSTREQKREDAAEKRSRSMPPSRPKSQALTEMAARNGSTASSVQRSSRARHESDAAQAEHNQRICRYRAEVRISLIVQAGLAGRAGLPAAVYPKPLVGIFADGGFDGGLNPRRVRRRHRR